MAIATTGEAAKLHPAMALIPRAPRSYPSSSHGLPSSRRPAGLLASSSSSSSRYVAGMCSSSSFVDPLEARDLRLRRMVEAFDPNVPLPQAVTPPSSWYTDPSFLDLELDRVFLRGWQAVGYTEQLQNPRDYFTGRDGPMH